MRSLLVPIMLFAVLQSPSAQAQSIDIVTAIDRATTRFDGRVIAADLEPGRPGEPEDLYVLRLLTAAGDIVEVRIDAGDGTIIEASGRGLVAARKRHQAQQ